MLRRLSTWKWPRDTGRPYSLNLLPVTMGNYALYASASQGRQKFRKLGHKTRDCSRLTYKPIAFYPNVTTLRSGLCCRNSVCRLSVVCRLSATLVHPTHGVEAFGKTSSPLCTLAIL